MSLQLQPPGAYRDSEIKPLVDMYRLLVAARYQGLAASDISKVIHGDGQLVSRKFDGELWFLVCDGSESCLVAPNGRSVSGDHPILKAASDISSGSIFAGELYRRTNERERVGDVARLLASGDRESELSFAVFDVVRQNDRTFEEMRFEERHGLITFNSERLHRIEWKSCNSSSEVEDEFDTLVLQGGAEGIVVRGADGRIFKVKPQQTIDAVVIGYTVRDDGLDVVARSLLLAVTVEDNFIVVGVSGNFGSDLSAAVMRKLLQPLECESEYKHTASTGQVYRMVQPRVIVEVQCLDLQSTDSRGMPMRQPTLQFENGQWRSLPTSAAVTMHNALALRIRDDKVIESDGASWRQVEPFSPELSLSQQLPESTVIRRQVWTKSSADKVDVRKLVVWKTNKEALDSSFPAYVVHWTDYSKTRKSPLDREVKIAPTEQEAMRIADAMIEENVKRGWVESTAQ